MSVQFGRQVLMLMLLRHDFIVTQLDETTYLLEVGDEETDTAIYMDIADGFLDCEFSIKSFLSRYPFRLECETRLPVKDGIYTYIILVDPFFAKRWLNLQAKQQADNSVFCDDVIDRLSAEIWDDQVDYEAFEEEYSNVS